MLHPLTMQTTVDITQTLICATVVLHSLEIIVERKQYRSGGIHSYVVLEKRYPWMIQEGWRASLCRLVFNSHGYLSLIVLELISALLVLSHQFPFFSGYFVSVILLIHLLSSLRNSYGLDGADQMKNIILVALLIFYLNSDIRMKSYCLFFICFQALLSYFTAGAVKATSAYWRSGVAIENILQQTRFRNEAFAQLLMSKPHLSKALCWSVIMFECAFPFLVFLGVRTCLIFLVAGVFFHLAIAFVMGLNSFFWSFVATYPAILFFANTFQQLVLAQHINTILK